MTNLISTLVGESFEGNAKSKGTLAAPNGSLYGIPYHAGRVAKFNPVDKSMTHIGPDFGVQWKWWGGAITGSGIIYCPPVNSNRGILKIDTNTDDVTELNRNLLPEQGWFMWRSCAVALDGCIYCMPCNARRIMKLDPNNNDAMSSVGDYLGRGFKYVGTVVGIDGCVYGIPYRLKRIVKYDPINVINSFVGEEADEEFKCSGNGALGRDGCIYAVTQDGRVLKIDTVNNSHCFSGNSIDPDHDQDHQGWGDAILGIDGCIYWPPASYRHILKYDPYLNQVSPVGDDYKGVSIDSIIVNWSGGCLASDGVIYCIPHFAKRILTIDPWKEFSMTVKYMIEEYPQNFGNLFKRSEEMESSTLSHQTETDHHAAPHKCANRYNESIIGLAKVLEKPTKHTPLHHVCKINFDHAVAKFGQEKVIETLFKHITPVNDFCKRSNLCPFMIVASNKESSVNAIYHFLCRDLSWVNGIVSFEVKVEGSALHVHGADKKRKKKKLEFRR